MRDLLFKNFTSSDRKKRVIASSEITDREGVRSVIHRHFVCMAKEIEAGKPQLERPLPYLFVLKERNTKEHKEKFFCRIKGSIYALSKGRMFLILFTHSLKINLSADTNQSIRKS